MTRLVRLDVNSESREVRVHPGRTLLDVLREDLELTGAKRGCDLGACGACCVLLDGRPVNACLTLALEAEGHAIVTIEGLEAGDSRHPLQDAFVEHGAVQCGFCTPGVILAAASLLEEEPEPDDARIREALSGNLCRCTGYVKILDAVRAAARTLREARACPTTPS